MTPPIRAISITTRSERQTQELAAQVARRLRPGDVVALVGILGAGKTCFVKGLARGLGLADTSIVRSPTFILASEYPTAPTLYHLDAYRLKDGGELEQIGFGDYLRGDGICVIEWADRIENCLPTSYLNVIMSVVNGTQRRVELVWAGNAPTDRMVELEAQIEQLRNGFRREEPSV